MRDRKEMERNGEDLSEPQEDEKRGVDLDIFANLTARQRKRQSRSSQSI